MLFIVQLLHFKIVPLDFRITMRYLLSGFLICRIFPRIHYSAAKTVCLLFHFPDYHV